MWAPSCQGQAQEEPGLVPHFPLLQTICPSLRFSLPASLEEGFSLLSKVSRPGGTRDQPSPPRLAKLPTPFHFHPGLLSAAEHEEIWAPSPMPGELPDPPHSSEPVLSLGGRGCSRAGEGAGGAGLCRLRAFTSGSPGKQRETRQRANHKLKLIRVTSAAWELEFPFCREFPSFAMGFYSLLDQNQQVLEVSMKLNLRKMSRSFDACQSVCCHFNN